MKKVFIIIICSIIFVSFFESCQDDLLNERNIRVPVADIYYQTAEGYEDLIDACYPYLRTIYGDYAGFAMTVLGTDLWMNGGDGNKDLGYYNILKPSTGYSTQVWDNCNLGLTACNTAIARAAGIPSSELTTDQLNSFLGEAYFLRALYYSWLVMNFGGVPLELEEIHTVKTTAVRATEQEVYDQIFADLLKAELLLPVTQTDYGRATKPAAEALLARVYLWNGKYAEAAVYAKKVINDYDFELMPDFKDLWSMANQHNSEVIFAVTYSKDVLLGRPSSAQHLFLARYDLVKGMDRDIANGRPYRYYMPTRYFLNMLQANRWKDSRFDKAYTTVWYANAVNPAELLPLMHLGDTALWIMPRVATTAEKARAVSRYTIYDINFYFDANSPNGWLTRGNRENFPSLNKWDDPERESAASTQGSKDFPVIRLAEMYLIATEALMMDSKASEGVTYMNTLLDRAAWPGHKTDMEITSGQLTIDFILEQRAFELAGECVGRWADLKRTGKLIERVRLYNPDGGPNIQDFHLLRPIPQTMMDRITNKEGFQNFGY